MAIPISGSQTYGFYQNDGRLYLGSETMVKRGFKVGDDVLVGGGYSQQVGKIVRLSDEFPHLAEVKLSSPHGSKTCWIKSEYLARNLT